MFRKKNVDYKNKNYAVRKTNDVTTIVNGTGGLFYAYRIDKNDDGKLDLHFTRSVIPSPRVGYFGASLPVTLEDHTLYFEIMNKLNIKEE